MTGEGFLLTNAHVAMDCTVVRVRRADGGMVDARLVATSPRDDLALLKVDERPVSAVAFRVGRPAKQGESVTVFGFPLAGLVSSTGNLTVGNITALSGPRDDARLMQISAAVQPGSSGGPVLDGGGNVVGVIVSKLDALAIAGVTGDIAQNINFAIKASVATNFLEAQGIEYSVGVQSPDLPTVAIADRRRADTVRIDCFK